MKYLSYNTQSEILMEVKMDTLEASFRDYLISEGYKQTTPSGHPSTVYDYCKRIEFVRG
jgi:hypothetical protein